MKDNQINNSETEEFNLLEKYKKLNSNNKILICLYILIILSIMNLINPYIINNLETKEEKVHVKGEYDISDFKEIDIDELENVAKSKDLQLVFIGTELDKNCVYFLPILQQAQDNFGYITNYLDVTKITVENKEKILRYDNKDKFLLDSLGSTPMILILKDNKLVEGWVGYSEYPEFEQFLIQTGFTKKK